MSLVTAVVYASQYLRALANRIHNKAIDVLESRIKRVQDAQVECEAQRSKLMVACHNRHYDRVAEITTEYNKALAKITQRFNAKQDKESEAFEQSKRAIAVTSQAASDDLKRELTALRSELDHLTK